MVVVHLEPGLDKQVRSHNVPVVFPGNVILPFPSFLLLKGKDVGKLTIVQISN